jgi:hypothetical protein
MPAPATLPEIDEALAHVAQALRRVQLHVDRRKALAYADSLLDDRAFLRIVLAESWDWEFA